MQPATLVSTVLGVMSAQAFRARFKGSGVVFYLIVLGMMVPGVLVGLGLALVANVLGIDRTWWGTAFVLHVVYTFPFAFLVMLAIFNRFDASVEEASATLHPEQPRCPRLPPAVRHRRLGA